MISNCPGDVYEYIEQSGKHFLYCIRWRSALFRYWQITAVALTAYHAGSTIALQITGAQQEYLSYNIINILCQSKSFSVERRKVFCKASQLVCSRPNLSCMVLITDQIPTSLESG